MRNIHLVLITIAVIAVATFVGLKSVETTYNSEIPISIQQIGIMSARGEIPVAVYNLAAFEKLKNPSIYFEKKGDVIYVYNTHSKSGKISLIGKKWNFEQYNRNILRGRIVILNSSKSVPVFQDVLLNPVTEKYAVIEFAFKNHFRNHVAGNNSIKISIYIKHKNNLSCKYYNVSNIDFAIASELSHQISLLSKNSSGEYAIEMVTEGIGSALLKKNDYALTPKGIVKLNIKTNSLFGHILLYGTNKTEYVAIMDSAILKLMNYNASVFICNSKVYLAINTNKKLAYKTTLHIGKYSYYVYDPVTGYPLDKVGC